MPLEYARWADLRRRMQENLGCVGAIQVYPSELLDLFEVIDRYHDALVDIVGSEPASGGGWAGAEQTLINVAQAALNDGSPDA